MNEFTDKSRILIVDDEPKIIHLVREILNASGYEVMAALSGEHAVEMVALDQPDLIILDLVLTGSVDGYEVARRIRSFSNVPIIMLTARVREFDKLQGFESGADDYITKPFSSKELLARVRAVLKRSKQIPDNRDQSMITCKDVMIDPGLRKVIVRGQEVHLTETEYNLLIVLATHPNQVLLHEYLLETVWGPEYRDDMDYLRVYIRFLRQKIEIDPHNPQKIQRCSGVGYVFVCPDEPPA